MNTLNITSWLKPLVGVIAFATFFPYATFFDTPFDTQPWALLLSCLLLVLVIIQQRSEFIVSLPTPLKILTFLLFYTGVLFAIKIIGSNVDYLAGIRSMWGYLSLVAMSYVGYKFWPIISEKLFLSATFIWFVVALAQLVFGKEIVAVFLSRFSTGGSRGLTSLAPEPAFYANVILIFMVLNEYYYAEKRYSTTWYFVVILVLLAQVVLSYSGVGIMMLLLFTGAKGIQLLFIRGKIKEKTQQIAVILLCVASVGSFYINTHMRETRAGALITTAVSEPVALKKDTSVSGRLINPIIGFYGGIVQTRGGGYGIGSEDKVTPPDYLAEAYYNNRTVGNRIEGGVPQSIYELGIIGFVLLGALVYILIKAIVNAEEYRAPIIVSSIVVFFPIMFFGSLANPLLGLLLGINILYAYKV